LPRFDLSVLVKVAFASGTGDLNPQLIDRLAEIYPELPLYVVAEFPPHRGEWIPYHPYRSWRDNIDACRAALAGKQIRLAAVLLVPRVPYRRMRLMALVLSVRGFLAFNENLDSFMLRPRSVPNILRHMAWRTANFFRWHLRKKNRAPVAPLRAPESGGDVAAFDGHAPRGLPVVVVVTAYLPFPLAHGGAVRIFNLMSRAHRDFDQVMLAFCDELSAPPAELLAICAEIVLIRRKGTHYRKSTPRPDMVEEMDSPALHAALKKSVAKWRPALAQLEFTPMAQYAPDCRPARTVLVEHDITFDLHEQLVRTNPTWEGEYQLKKWRAFETAIWPKFDRVVTMSMKDRDTVGLPGARCLPNGVDLDRFRPVTGRQEPGRVLFIGSFTHLPNLLALEFFLRDVWPKLDAREPVLHVIAGARHQFYLEFYRKKIDAPRVEVEGFVADVRDAYARASVVIAPLTASAGTNIKILEAMAMGKAIVSTPAGINGLDVVDALIVASDAGTFAHAVRRCLEDTAERERLETAARAIAERDYGWDSIAEKQRAMYRELIGATGS
jgi:glycosyltransferase involved in cell wall biosynthesis